MYVTVLSEIHRTHLDPRIGFTTPPTAAASPEPRRRRDLQADSRGWRIFSLVNRRLKARTGQSDPPRGLLTRKGKIFLEAYESRLKETVQHPRLGRAVIYRRLIRLELYKLEKHLLEDELYSPTSPGGNVFVLMIYDVDVKVKVLKLDANTSTTSRTVLKATSVLPNTNN